MAKVQNEELSYMDLCYLLTKDVRSDTCMPDEDRAKALQTISTLVDVLWKYSA